MLNVGLVFSVSALYALCLRKILFLIPLSLQNPSADMERMETSDTAPDIGFVMVDNRLLKSLRQDVETVKGEAVALRAELTSTREALAALAHIMRDMCIDQVDIKESCR